MTILKYTSLCLLLAFAVKADKDDPQDCKHIFRIKKGDNIDLHLHNVTNPKGGNHFCTLQVTTEKDMRIVLDLVYAPALPSRRSPPTDCNTDYVHVGNDAGRVDINLMTSYKFCGEDVRHELISRGNHMWLVFRASQTPRNFFVKVQAQSPVVCTHEEFPCSPVQCVLRSRICDGIKDCSNGHDEFCHRVGLNFQGRSWSEPCFRCGDGTCIQPRLSPYDISYGRVLWYLCDGFSHCPDAWDERRDICTRLQNGRVGSVTECVPSDLQFGHNGSVMMWNEIRCDNNPDCFHGDDEDGCYGNDSRHNKLRADPLTIGVVVAVVVTGCIVACVAYKIKNAIHPVARPSTSSTVDTTCTHCTSVEEDHSARVMSTGQVCGSHSCPANGSRKVSFQDELHNDIDDEDKQSFCSVTIRQSTV